MNRPYIYVASSWRNEKRHDAMLKALQGTGADVYNFRNPAHGATGFAWEDVDQKWGTWSAADMVDGLDHPVARKGFRADMNALAAADLCILVLPCGRSAHLELGYAVGAGKPTAVWLDDGEAELMYAMVDFLSPDANDVCLWALRTCAKLSREGGEP